MSVELPLPFGWYAVADSKDVESGDVQAIEYFEEKMVLFRTESGEAKVLDAYCPHLGAHLGVGGRVVGEHIACPFHAWELDGTGEVKRIPYGRTMPKRTTQGPCIRSYPTLERNGFIWAWFHPRSIEPTFDVPEIKEFSDPDWTEPDNYEWEFNSRIQETGENAVDIAHFVYVHNAMDMPKAEIDLDGTHRITKMISMGPAIDDDGNMDFDKTDEMHLVTESWGPGMTCQVFERAYKTVMIGTVLPISRTRVKLRFSFVKPRDLSELFTVYTDGLIAEIVRQVQHDIPIWENKIYREDPILCDGDGPINKYRQWFQQFYDIGEDATPVRLVK